MGAVSVFILLVEFFIIFKRVKGFESYSTDVKRSAFYYCCVYVSSRWFFLSLAFVRTEAEATVEV